MNEPKVFADFQNADTYGRLRLNTNGTTRDVSSQKINLRDGVVLRLYDHDEDENGNPLELQIIGRVLFSSDEQCWVASVDWSQLERVPAISANGPRA